MSVRRITVVQGSAQAGRALAAVAEAAAALEAELHGLFLEDVELLHFAALPFAREIGVSARPRRLDVPTMERRLRGEAEEARRALAAAAEGKPLRWSFRVERGSLPARVRSALADADLVVLLGDRGGRPARRALALVPLPKLPQEVEMVLQRLVSSLAGDICRLQPAMEEKALAGLLRDLWGGAGLV
jgi:hypothetical protein